MKSVDPRINHLETLQFEGLSISLSRSIFFSASVFQTTRILADTIDFHPGHQKMQVKWSTEFILLLTQQCVLVKCYVDLGFVVPYSTTRTMSDRFPLAQTRPKFLSHLEYVSGTRLEPSGVLSRDFPLSLPTALQIESGPIRRWWLVDCEAEIDHIRHFASKIINTKWSRNWNYLLPFPRNGWQGSDGGEHAVAAQG